jgi:hypothetical protein
MRHAGTSPQVEDPLRFTAFLNKEESAIGGEGCSLRGMIAIGIIMIFLSGPPCLLDIKPSFASGAGFGFAHPCLPTIMTFRTFHLFHINTVVIRVLITFDCISRCILAG